MRMTRSLFTGLLLALLGGLAACTIMPAADPTEGRLFMLDAMPAPAASPGNGKLTLLVSTPRGHAGYETANMAYVDQQHTLSYFSKSHWADAPSRMLTPLLVRTLEQSGDFKAVAQAPSPALAQLRLDSELTQLHQDFTQKPSRVRLTLRVQLIALGSGEVIAGSSISHEVAAASDTPYGGVIAANQALVQVLADVRQLCHQQVAGIE